MTPKEILKRFVELFNRGDAAGLSELYADDAVNHQVANSPVAGKEAIRKMFENEFASAEMTCIVENLFEDGEWAVMEWRDPKGLRGCGFFHVVNGKIVFQRGYWDKLSFLKQAGRRPYLMRKKKREIADPAAIREIIANNNSAVLSMIDGAFPYGVMMNYAPVFEDSRVKLIFHCAPEGRKIDCLRENPAVSVFINDSERTRIVGAGAESAHWTTWYRSAVLAGEVRFLDDPAEKRLAVEQFMRHYTDGDINLPEQVLNVTCVFELNVDIVTAKQNPAP